MPYLSTKYDSPLAEFLHGLVLEDLANAEIGNVQELGFYAKFIFDENDSQTIEDHWRNELDDLGINDAPGGCFVLVEDDQGFVTVTQYETLYDLEEDWDRIETMYDAHDNQTENDF